MRPDQGPSPAELRAVLGRNLRILIAGAGSVSAICNKIGVNRTQFNRYLNGDAFPRPDVLHRICTFFGVDARIILEPLEGIRKDQRLTNALVLHQVAFRPGSRPFDHFLLPDGLYRFWRRSFATQGKYILGLALFHTANGVKLYKSFDIYPTPVRSGTRRFARKVPNTGVVLQHFDGFSVMCATESDHALSFSFFEYGLNGNTRYSSGITLLTRRQMVDVGRASVVILERIDHRTALETARKLGLVEADEIPVAVRAAIDRLPPSL
jgi:transcriptional regulator with XRE-family HTH domain